MAEIPTVVQGLYFDPDLNPRATVTVRVHQRPMETLVIQFHSITVSIQYTFRGFHRFVLEHEMFGDVQSDGRNVRGTQILNESSQ